MKTIWKYPLKIVEDQVVSIPASCELLHVIIQHVNGVETPTLYAIVDPEKPSAEISIKCIGTGDQVESIFAGHYLGTTMMNDDAMVKHWFKKVQVQSQPDPLQNIQFEEIDQKMRNVIKAITSQEDQIRHIKDLLDYINFTDEEQKSIDYEEAIQTLGLDKLPIYRGKITTKSKGTLAEMETRIRVKDFKPNQQEVAEKARLIIGYFQIYKERMQKTYQSNIDALQETVAKNKQFLASLEVKAKVFFDQFIKLFDKMIDQARFT